MSQVCDDTLGQIYLTMEETERDPDLPRCRYGHAPCSPYELEDLIQENAERSRKRKVI
jgi:hypothetical protein